MRLYRCDRCRKEFDDVTVLKEGERRPMVGVIVGGPLVGLSATTPDYDLCANCADALRRWLKPATEVAS